MDNLFDVERRDTAVERAEQAGGGRQCAVGGVRCARSGWSSARDMVCSRGVVIRGETADQAVVILRY